MLERQVMKRAVHLQQLLPGVICTSRLRPHIIFESFLLSSHPFSHPYIKKISSWFSFYSLCFPFFHPCIFFIIPPPSLLFLPSSPLLISSNSTDSVSHWCSHYNAQGASPLHLPVMDFQCFDHLTYHVVMSPPWVASLCKLFRNA